MSTIHTVIADIKNKLEVRIDKIDNSVASSHAILETIREFEFVLSSELRDFRFGLRSGVYEISCLLDKGFRELSYQLALKNQILDEVVDRTLYNTIDTKSKQIREEALIEYTNGIIEKSENDLIIIAEKYPQDFIVHHILGNIYFYHKNNYDRAYDYYYKAAKYAGSHSTHHAVESFVSAALVCEKMNKIELADEMINNSRSLLDDSAWVLYHHSRIVASKGKIKEFIPIFIQCIVKDEMYLVAASIDPSIAYLRSEISSITDDLCKREEKKLLDLIGKIDNAKIIVGIKTASGKNLDVTYNKIDRFRKNGSYLDLCKARRVAASIIKKSAPQWIAFKEEQIADYENSLNRIKEAYTHYALGCLPAIIIWFIIYTFVSSIYTFEPEMRGPVDIYQITYRGSVYIDLNGDRTRTYPRGHVFEVLKHEEDILCLGEPKEGWRYCWEGTGRNQLLEMGSIGSGEITDYSRTLSGWQIVLLIIIAPIGVLFLSGQLIQYYRCERAEERLSKTRKQLLELEKIVNL